MSERIHFRLIQTPCCGQLLCWVNPRLPNYCPECSKPIYRLLRFDGSQILVSDENAWLHARGIPQSEQPASPAAADYTEQARELLRSLHCWRLLYHNARPIDDPDVGQIAAVLSVVAIRAFGKVVWSDTEEVAYQAGVSDTLARLHEPDVQKAVAEALADYTDTEYLAAASVLTKIAEMLK